jgi:hypothetical protein
MDETKNEAEPIDLNELIEIEELEQKIAPDGGASYLD